MRPISTHSRVGGLAIALAFAALSFAPTARAATSPLTVGDRFEQDSAQIEVRSIRSCAGAGAVAPVALGAEDLAADAGPDGERATMIEVARGGLSCSTRERISSNLDLEATVIAAGAAFLACTVAGAPVAVDVAAVGAGVSVINLVVKKLPCDSSDDERKIDLRIQRAVCDTLARNGIRCGHGV